MKRRIDATDGLNYTYEFSDGSKQVLTAGKDGVTEDIICQLKRMDNNQYVKDLDFAGRKPTEKEKEQWAQTHHPDEKMGRIWNASLDYINENGSNTPEEYLCHQIVADEENPQIERLHELIEMMPPKRQKVLSLYFNGFSQSEIARQMGLSTSTVRDHMRAAEKFIEKNF